MTGSAPRTAAGRALLATPPGFRMGIGFVEAILAIEAEASLPDAEAWQQGYTDAWNRLHEPDALARLLAEAAAAPERAWDGKIVGNPALMDTTP